MAASAVDPKPIHRLEESLINRIAAGEIIHRPANALKELLENALDAGATQIKITAKDGGLKLLQIVDNGSGIRRADLPLLAARFCTSKLSTFSDLSKLQTYGFRGEALASISHVAHLNVVTKTRDDSCAWRASYSDGLLAPAKAGTSADPKPCAGNDGTTITVEDLFYNTPLRLRALKSPSDEYARILDVVQRYAIHNPSVSFLCKKTGSNTADVSTPSSGTVKSAIQTIYGPSVAKELLEAQAEAGTKDEFEWQAEAWFTSANYHAKKPTFLLFINHRSVESARVKRAVEAVYSGILPKGACGFIYLSLDIDPSKVDVNVHPTKREVHFLEEEAITEKVADSMQAVLAANDQSRTFQYQTVLTGHSPFKSQGKMKRSDLQKERTPAGSDEEIQSEDEVEDEENEQDLDLERPRAGPSSSLKPSRKPSQPSYKKIRNDLKTRTLDSMFPVLQSSSESQSSQPNMEIEKKEKAPAISESRCFLTSVQELRAAVKKAKHSHLAEIIVEHTYVGIASMNLCLSLVQSSTKLFLINHAALSEELFYQLGLMQFGNIGKLTLEPAPSLEELVRLAVDAEAAIKEQGLIPEKIIKSILKTIMAQRAMLAEYFSLEITSSGEVSTLPLLLPGYTPNLDRLPLFLMRLAPQVNWTSESECFSTFLRELAYFYVPGRVVQEKEDPAPEEQEEGKRKSEEWQIEHVLFPAFRKYLVPPRGLLERDVVQVAELRDLYRVFERC
ncbi:DNA mismatch repair protein MutL [Dacryopinax primogenitus]|uniref:DNA mismatch repair protein MutL n=1 Tax=Dacryopinax primogenitus (strain DJM 731) TaxID=1858805 RepID=M5FMY6_DACPD|nr:DNA mismatch repair protein MutL [Dacryopinax primogenitus]EJT96510.1 DNA mismatch repair protein MutL [Dacryopinax primogenitus]